MRKFVTLFALMAALVAGASPIDWSRAEMIANQFNRSVIMQPVSQWQRVQRRGAPQTEAPYYVFNHPDGKGFVIVSGDDAAEPILGYATQGTFSYEDMPDNLRHWLSLNEAYVNACRQRSATQHRVVSQGTPVVQPLLGDILWGQGEPYNSMCPTYSGTHYYVGCVATAVTQIMRYHKYPEHGTGSKTITVNGQSVTADFGNTTYDWDSMLPTYDDVQYTSDQANAVATLAAQFGVAVDMEYAPEGSGAHSMVVPAALRDYFTYDQAVTMRKRDYYDSAEWLELIKSELDAGRPVYYAASSDVGFSGHAFVCDGYDTEGFVHINWGWYGRSNGYFLVSHLDPDDLGIGGGTGGYNRDQEIITGIQPPASQTIYERPLYNSLSMRLVTQSSDKFDVMTTIENFDTEPFTGQAGVALVRDGKIVKVLKVEQQNIQGFASGRTGIELMAKFYDIPKQVGSEVADGDATLWMVFRESDEADWQLMRYCRGRDSRGNPYVGFFNTTVVDGCIQNIDESCAHPDVTILSDLLPDDEVYEQGTAMFNLRLRNNSETVRLSNIVIRFTSTADDRVVFDYENEVKVYDSLDETVSLLVNLSDSMPSGEYRLTAFEKGFEQYPFEQTQGEAIVQVLPKAETPVMRLTTAVQWRRADSEQIANQGDNVYFALNARNYGSAGNVGVILNLVDVNDPTKSYVYQQSNATVAQGEARTFTFYRKLPVDPGTYRVIITYATDDGKITADPNNDTYPLTINIGEASDIFLNAVAIDLPDYVVKGEKLTGSLTLSAPSDHNGYVYVRMRQYTLTNGGILYMGNQQIAQGEEKTINISSRIDFEPGRYLIMVEARHGSTEGTVGNYANCYKLINVVTELPTVRGDVTGDGKVDVSDVNMVINMMLGKAEPTAVADVTGDGTVDVSDVNIVINIMLGK